MADIKLFADGRLPTRAATVPNDVMIWLADDQSKRENYYQQFIAQWFLSYERLSVPQQQRFEISEATANKELLPYANRLIEKYPGVTRDVIWEAWDMGLMNYFVDNGATAFPMFNFGVLILFINRYRGKAQLKLWPDTVSEEARAGLGLAAKMEVIPVRELLSNIRAMGDEQARLMMELQSATYQPLFLHLAKRMQEQDPTKYKALQSAAKLRWCNTIGEKLGLEADGLMKLEVRSIVDLWAARFKQALQIAEFCPSPWTDWRILLLAEAEVYV